TPNVANVFISSIRIDFGDGVHADLGSTPGTVTHPFLAGVYTVTATATDTVGNQARATLPVFVAAGPKPAAPSIGLTTSTTLPTTIGTVVSFNVIASIPGSAAGTFIQNIHIDFGDGFSFDLGGTSATVTHTYSAAGTFTVTAMALAT